MGNHCVLTAVASMVKPEGYEILWCHLDDDGHATSYFQMEHAKAFESFLDQTALKQRLYKCLFGTELLFTVAGSEHNPKYVMVQIPERDFSDLDPVFTITELAEDKHDSRLPPAGPRDVEPEGFLDFPLSFPVYALVSTHRIAGGAQALKCGGQASD